MYKSLPLIIVLALLPFAAFGQTTPPPAPPAPTLDAALATASIPQGGVVLAVDASGVKLPDDSQAPPSGSSLGSVAQAYGRIDGSFGAVEAIAPATMTAIYVPPAQPNPYENMPQGEVFKLLAASFTPANWQEILSDQGLGIDDLSTDDQKQEFQAFFPDWQIKVAAESPNGDVDFDHPMEVTTDASQVRIRLSQLVSLGLQVTNQPNSHMFSETVDPGGHTSYMALTNDDWSINMIDGALVREDLPNVLKVSQLDYRAAVFGAQVPLTNVKTAGDLIKAISQATRVEIYVDRRLEGKKLTVVGAPTAPAGDLLRALALCVTGTYRQVGQAFVLTNDLIGLGTRRQMWADFEAQAEAMRAPTDQQAEAAISASNHSMLNIPWYGDPMAVSQSEMQAWQDQVKKNGYFENGGMFEVTLPFDQMTATQQQAGRMIQDYDNRTHQSVTTDGTVMIQSQLELEALVPSLDGPVSLGADMTSVFPDQRIQPAPPPPPPSAAGGNGAAVPRPSPPPTPPLRPALMSKTRRAVILEPQTAADVDSIVASMKALGLNELWLVVFSEGLAHYPTKYATSDAPTDGSPDILSEAIRDTKGTGIKVYAALNLLQWGGHPPADAVDYTLAGETSQQAYAHEQQTYKLQVAENNPDAEIPTTPPSSTPEVAVCPLAPDVVSALSGMAAELAGRPGVAGIVWRDLATPGYLPPGPYPTGNEKYDLGFNEAARLSFLRKEHADPVDLIDNSFTHGRANTRLDGFDSWDLDQSLYKDWTQFRSDADVSFLRQIAGPLNLDNGLKKSAGAKVPLLVEARQTGSWTQMDWYGSWENLQAPVPTVPFPVGGIDQNGLKEARQASRIAICDYNSSSYNTAATSPYFVRGVAFELNGLRGDPSYAGYVLDFTPIYSPYDLYSQSTSANPPANPLAPLVAALGPSANPSPSP